MIKVQLLQDESSHWYIVPNDEADVFSEMIDKMIENDYDIDYINSFDNKFSKYRTGGSLNNYQLFLSEEEMKKLTKQ